MPDSERPDSKPIPIDSIHSFFLEPMSRKDPIVKVWRKWFRLTRTKFRARRLSGRLVQFYVHRSLVRHGRSVWCCQTSSPSPSRWWLTSSEAKRVQSTEASEETDAAEMPSQAMPRTILLPDAPNLTKATKILSRGDFLSEERTELIRLYGPLTGEL